MKVASTIILFLLIFMGTPTWLHAQVFTIDSLNNTADYSGDFKGAEINLRAVKKKPDFPGGKKPWLHFLLSNINIKVPFENKAIPGTYRVMIRFVVGRDGKLWEIGAVTNCGYGMESEVIRCIKKSPQWIPAETSSGKKVRFTLRTMVIFTVKQNDIVISFQ